MTKTNEELAEMLLDAVDWKIFSAMRDIYLATKYKDDNYMHFSGEELRDTAKDLLEYVMHSSEETTYTSTGCVKVSKETDEHDVIYAINMDFDTELFVPMDGGEPYIV